MIDLPGIDGEVFEIVIDSHLCNFGWLFKLISDPIETDEGWSYQIEMLKNEQ